jgi:hypothetical protein
MRFKEQLRQRPFRAVLLVGRTSPFARESRARRHDLRRSAFNCLGSPNLGVQAHQRSPNYRAQIYKNPTILWLTWTKPSDYLRNVRQILCASRSSPADGAFRTTSRQDRDCLPTAGNEYRRHRIGIGQSEAAEDSMSTLHYRCSFDLTSRAPERSFEALLKTVRKWIAERPKPPKGDDF